MKYDGYFLKAKRNAFGLAQREIADAIGTSIYYICAIERGYKSVTQDRLVDYVAYLDELERKMKKNSPKEFAVYQKQFYINMYKSTYASESQRRYYYKLLITDAK